MNNQEMILKGVARLHAHQVSTVMSKVVFSQLDSKTVKCNYHKHALANYLKQYISNTKTIPNMPILDQMVVQWKDGYIFVHKDKKPIKFDTDVVTPELAFAITLIPHILSIAILTIPPIVFSLIEPDGDFELLQTLHSYALCSTLNLTKSFDNEDCFAHRCQTIFNYVCKEILEQLSTLHTWNNIDTLPWALPNTQLIFYSGHTIAQLSESDCHVGTVSHHEEAIWHEAYHFPIADTIDLIKTLLKVRMVSLSDLTTTALLNIPEDWATMKFTDFKEHYRPYWGRSQ